MGRYKKIIRWSLAACCLAYIVWFFVKNREDLRFVFNLQPLVLAFLICLFFLGHLIYSYRFGIVLKKCSNQDVPLWPLLKMVILGRFLGIFAPQAGNIYRSVVLKRNFSVAYTRYASSLFSFAWLDTCFNLIYAVVVVLAVKPSLRIGGLSALILLVVLAGSIILLPILFEFFFKLLKFKNRRLAWLHSKVSEMLGVSIQVVQDWRYMLRIIVTGAGAFLNTVIIFYLCFKSLAVHIDLPSLALFYVILKLSTQIIITPGNLGIREIAYGILSDQMQIGMAQGLVVSVIMRILGTGIIIILGTVFGGSQLLSRRQDYSSAME